MAALRRAAAVACVLALALGAAAQLTPTFYDGSCPRLQSIVRAGMAAAVQQEPRMGASLLRLFFHDCFVQVRITSPSLSCMPTQFARLQLPRDLNASLTPAAAARACVSLLLACRGATRRCCWTTRRR